MKDNKGIIQQVSSVVDDGYKVNVNTSAGFKVFSPHLTYISDLESLNLGLNFKLHFFILFFALLILMPSYTLSADKSEQFKFSKDQQIQQVKPKKPVRIKLHRNAKGEYSWELTGDNVDEVFQADRRLRKLLKIE
jgi:hypothetical protein